MDRRPMSAPCDSLEDTLRRARNEELDFLLRSSAVKTRRRLVDPVLESLGWDLSDQQMVYVEPYEELTALNKGKPDYTLYVKGVEWACVKAAPLCRVESMELGVQYLCDRCEWPTGVATDGRTWKIRRDGSWTIIGIDKDGACESLCNMLSPDGLKADYGRKMDEIVCELAPRFREKEPEDTCPPTRANANRAVVLFTNVVLDNKHRYQNDEDMFRRARRVYNNILHWAESKHTLRKALDDIDGLDGNTKEEIIRLSVPGKFQGITRSGYRGRVDEEYRKRFLELFEEFAGTGKPYGQLMRDPHRNGWHAACLQAPANHMAS